jgi:hypothetical protein
VHEYGHRIMHVQYGGYFPPFPNCNPHYIQYASSQGCAWTEGWADFMPLVVNGNPYFEWASGSYLDLENRGWGDGWDEGDDVEGRVAGAMYDWMDPAGEDWDYSNSYPFDYVWDTLTGHIDDIFNDYWLDWVHDGRPVYNPCYSMYQNTIVYDSVGPDMWRYFYPTSWWTTDQTPWCYVQVRDIMSGLRVSNGGWYRYTNNGGSTWSGWTQADAVGGFDGTTAWQWIDVYDVPFNHDSGNQNYIQFAIADMEWNWGYSGAYLVLIDTTAPWNPTSYGGDPMPGYWTNQKYITAWWSGFGDATSGVDGFAVLFNKDAYADPGYTKNVEEDAQTTEGPFSDGDWWITFRTVDNAGNWAGSYVYGASPWKIETQAPGSWRNFEPSDWVADLTPDCTVQVKDAGRAGLQVDPSSARYRYSTDGGSSWSGWQAASVTGVNGSMNYETITASGVPFNKTSKDKNLIDFKIDDQAGNTGYSPDYVVMVARETTSDSGYFNFGWVWFSIPLDPDGCCGGDNCYDPNTILGFDAGGSLFKWDKYGKFAQVYKPPFVLWDLAVGNSYLLGLSKDKPDPTYWGLDPKTPFEFLLGKKGWTWVGKPGIGRLTGSDFMNSVRVQYPVGGTTRTAQQDYDAVPNNWVSWGWSYYDPYLDAVKTFTPYAPFGNRTCYPWFGYRVWVNVGAAPDEFDRDQVLLIWP